MSIETKVEAIGIGRVMKDVDLHDALTDSADWNAPYWDFHKENLQSFRSRLIEEFEAAPEGLIVSAIWAGDSVEEQINLSIDDFLSCLDAGRIGTRTKYLILKEGRTNRCTQ